MESLSYKSEIADTFSNIRNFSYQEKKSSQSESEMTNQFLDAILDFKNHLKEKTTKINTIVDEIEKLTWLNNLDNESLMLLNDLIAIAKDLKMTLIRQYVSLEFFRTKGIAKQEVNDFKNAIDDLKESYEDLESTFFYLPEIPEFSETTEKLSLI
ncbi:MAG: hypothetical protein GVY05_09705 [Bacteroidetes bacterium]|jgi:hypothetical protein|nr:hypothetical protein [Bacteroidota bacterium]